MELKSIYSSQKSFCKKAKIITENNVIKLQSYNTIVAVKEGNNIKVNGYYSKTTAIHINEFLMQQGAKKLSKKEMELEPIVQI